MNIHNNKPPDSQGVFLRSQKLEDEKTLKDKGRVEGSTGSDRVNLSKRAKDIEEMRNFIGGLPETRESKIEEIREAIQSGTYQINSMGIAARMLEEGA